MSWIFIDKILLKIKSKFYRGILKYIMGLMFLYIIAFFSMGGILPFVSLFEINSNHQQFLFSIILHLIYTTSFLLASLVYLFKKRVIYGA